MNRYIRIKNGIIDLASKQVSSYEIIDDKTAIDEYGEDGGFIMIYYYNQDVGEHIEYDNKGGHSMDNWYLKDILDQADTIEELCTDIIVKNYEEQYPSTSPIGVSISWKAYQPIVKDVEGIYGAIWVKGEKGEPILKSVAKMNEKGELELL